MNILRRCAEYQRHIKKVTKKRAILSAIPPSHLTGIDALPVELWSVIIEQVVRQELGHPQLRCLNIARILSCRMVCHVFDIEVQRSLRQHVTLPQLPYLSLMRIFYHQSRTRNYNRSLYTPLLASALCNSSSRPQKKSKFVKRRTGTPRIADRIQNCTIIADHICPPFQQMIIHRKELMQRFCAAASTSTYCQEYMYTPSYYERGFRTLAEGDAYLEAALLVACGYGLEDVKWWMVKLAKKGMLAPYR